MDLDDSVRYLKINQSQKSNLTETPEQIPMNRQLIDINKHKLILNQFSKEMK